MLHYSLTEMKQIETFPEVNHYTPVEIHKCDGCDASFENLAYLVTHQFEKHRKEKIVKQSAPRRFECSKCSESFLCIEFLNKHMLSKHQNIKSLFNCHCKKSFDSHEELSHHKETHKSTNMSPKTPAHLLFPGLLPHPLDSPESPTLSLCSHNPEPDFDGDFLTPTPEYQTTPKSHSTSHPVIAKESTETYLT